MNKLILILAFLVIGCSDISNVDDIKKSQKVSLPEFDEIKIDDCEYIYVKSNYRAGITHKGNCSNHIHECK